MRPVDVQSCVLIDGRSVCVPQGSVYRFITVQPLLLNHADLLYYIELLQSAPGVVIDKTLDAH